MDVIIRKYESMLFVSYHKATLMCFRCESVKDKHSTHLEGYSVDGVKTFEIMLPEGGKVTVYPEKEAGF